MTTENVVVLFSDVVDSTVLAHRVSPDAADEDRRRHFSILRQALAESEGTEVKTMGDGVMAVFASASAALSCAVAMQQGVEQENRRADHGVGLRVGLSGGEVTREGDDYFGDPVVEAARLCASCEAGQVLAAEVVRLTAGRRSRHRCRATGALALKGLPEPVEAVEVLWDPFEDTGTDAVLLPHRLATRPGAGVVGRGAELARLREALARVVAGDGREVVLVSGEAGVGKTTLVAEVARAADEGGAWVLFGHCEEDLATPYQLFAEALGHYVTHAPEDELVAHVEADGSELRRLVPALAGRLPGLPPSKATDGDTERALLFGAAVGLLGAASSSRPVVLVLDDLQWADGASLQLLRHLVAADMPTRLLVLGTYRPSSVPLAHPLVETLAALHRQARVSQLDVTGLDGGAVHSLLEAAVGHSLDDATAGLARAVHRETDGNAFFVTELLRHLAETGAIGQPPTERPALPDSVRMVIGARVGRLGPEAERVLSVAAVIGRDFDLDLLARATRLSEDDVLDVLEAASATSLVRELSDGPGHHTFAHALIQRTLYEDFGLSRRARAHRAVAEALEDICGDRPGARVGELARHWSASGSAGLDKALEYSRQAADVALAALAPADALRAYRDALDLYARAEDAGPVLGVDLAIGLGTAQRQTGDPAFRETLLDAARAAAELGETGRLVDAAIANHRGFYSAVGTFDTDKVAVLELALERLPAGDPARALVLSTLCGELAYGSPLDRRQELADEALTIAAATGDDATIVRVSNNLLAALNVPSLLEPNIARTADALARAERVGDPGLLFWAALGHGEAAARAGDVDEVDRCFATTYAIADQLGQPTLQWVARFTQALQALTAGDPETAERLATEALQIGSDTGQPDAMTFYGAQFLQVRLMQGTIAGVIPVIEQLARDVPDVGPSTTNGWLAYALAEERRVDEALVMLDEFGALDYELPVDQLWLAGMIGYATAAVECRDPVHADALLARLTPLRGQLSTAGLTFEGPVALALGELATVLGRFDDAEIHFREAAALNERVGARFYGARNAVSWARMLAERAAAGDVAEARRLLTEAHAVAVASGYAGVERRATEALDALP